MIYSVTPPAKLFLEIPVWYMVKEGLRHGHQYKGNLMGTILLALELSHFGTPNAHIYIVFEHSVLVFELHKDIFTCHPQK